LHRAASFITGQILPVDGGITTHTPYFADVMDTTVKSAHTHDLGIP
jgi:hypothetical protein